MAELLHLCKECKEEKPKTVRKIDPRSIKIGAPRCRSHFLVFRDARRKRSTDTRARNVYGLPEGLYEALKEFQGGKCYVCQVATGKTKALSVDHDHDLAKLHDHPVDQGCVDCVRGLLCHTCNVVILGRYGEAALLRAIEYRKNPPMKRFMNAKA